MRIERGERYIGYSAAALAAISFAVLWVPNLHHASRGVTGEAYLAVGLVLAAFLALATFIGRRVLVALGALFITVGPWGPERLFQLLYLALTLWITVRLLLRLRAAKTQAEASPVPVPVTQARPVIPAKKAAKPAHAATADAGHRARSARPVPLARADGNHRAGRAERGAGGSRRSRTPVTRAAVATRS
jgi:hypothetical protein